MGKNIKATISVSLEDIPLPVVHSVVKLGLLPLKRVWSVQSPCEQCPK